MVVFPAKRAAATLFGLWRYDDDIWLYGLCCDGKRKIECSIATVICILDVLQNWLVPFFFFISISLYYTTVVAFNASFDAVLLHQKLMENCPSFRSGLPSRSNS
jgi:hypothetical protein